MLKPRVCVLKTDGTNCDKETAHAFRLAGGDAEVVRLPTLFKGYDPVQRRDVKLADYDILAVPGGFSEGDYIASGVIFADDLKHFLGEEIEKFADDGKPMVGICNGFQVFTKYGLLPRFDEKTEWMATLTNNESGRFRDDWVNLVRINKKSKCIWTREIDNIDLPIAHGEGRFVADQKVIDRLFEENLVVLQYAQNRDRTMNFPYNPNGSMEGIAGICNPTGTIFGLMPHPERYLYPNRHRLSTLQRVLSQNYIDSSDPYVAQMRHDVGVLPEVGLGLKMFKNAVQYCKP